MLKTILKFILYAGAVACCLAGLWAIYLVICGFRDSWHPEDWPYELALAAIYLCLAFAPAFMFLKGLNTKTWQWVAIAAVEVVVLALALYALLVLVALSLTGGA